MELEQMGQPWQGFKAENFACWAYTHARSLSFSTATGYDDRARLLLIGQQPDVLQPQERADPAAGTYSTIFPSVGSALFLWTAV